MQTRLKLNHLPLEAYRARYTEFLHQWENRAFGQTFNVNPITPDTQWKSLQINTGEVLDAVSRPVWAMAQVSELLKQAPTLGHCWFSDFFHPGLEALPYSRSHYRAYSFLWAQTFDTYDFTNQFRGWMRPWEVMAFEIYEQIFVACDLLKEMIDVSIGAGVKVHAVGLPFNSKQVFGRLGVVPENRSIDCVYTSRFDTEKNPMLFLELVNRCAGVTFAICTGHPTLKGTDHTAIRRARELQQQGKLTIHENLDKEAYYHILATSRVQFNCAKQDWVSFTLLEALTFGCMPLYPNFRAFPDTLLYERSYLYTPEDVNDAADRLMTLLNEGEPKTYQDFRMHILDYHDSTLNRIATAIAEG